MGNAAVVQMLRQAGHPWAQETHQRNAGCGHQQAEQPVQRSTVPDVLRSPGQPLDESTRTEMESGLGADFSDVRVHTGEAARRSAAEIGARAYTSGSHVVLGEGGADRHTLAHELTHVVQQRRGPVSGSNTGQGFRLSDPGDRFEREADAVASRVLARPAPAPAASSGGQPACPDGGQVQRAPDRQSKRRKLETGQQTLMDVGVSASLAQERERARAMNEDGRHAMFIAALSEKFAQSDGWTVRDTARGKIAIRNQKESGPHDYMDEPEVESLRWISTVVKRYLIADGEDPVEVQAAIGDKGELIVAANNRQANAYLFRQVNDGMSFIGTALQKGPVTEEDWVKEQKGGTTDEGTKNAAVGRENRHFTGLGMLHSGQDPKVAERYRKVLGAIGEGVVVADNGDSGLHAERRICIRNGNRTPGHLAGTKRPCATCFSKLYPGKSEEDLDAPDAVRPGIFFFDKWSNVGIEEYKDTLTSLPSQRAAAMFRQIDGNVPRTHVTRARNGKIVPGAGSDSD
ncbi:eCIS core domain-containing protein [Frankia sp. AgKG'84/4]|uniref:eCIS core domain-containing protein n=1 Tax=Frankia sp. AgKG'84/4 TaxID=573490 RepID=UPI00201034DA|nr:DUF4157 domain-containing protein [Frankia sp. AgKG'84/4]MCL9796276.1 DUF4157 domain-containing protein [Frankia sp. AgKG'84/4]